MTQLLHCQLKYNPRSDSISDMAAIWTVRFQSRGYMSEDAERIIMAFDYYSTRNDNWPTLHQALENMANVPNRRNKQLENKQKKETEEEQVERKKYGRAQLTKIRDMLKGDVIDQQDISKQ
jgi:hypothetical protein